MPQSLRLGSKLRKLSNVPLLLRARTSHTSYTDELGGWYGYDAVWYTLLSFHLIKKPSDYFSIVFYYQTASGGSDGYNEPGPYDPNTTEFWLQEYDYINMGNPLGAYYKITAGGRGLFLRHFEKGYVIVDPQSAITSTIDKEDLSITGTVRQITEDNMTRASWELATSGPSGARGQQKGIILYHTPYLANVTSTGMSGSGSGM